MADTLESLEIEIKHSAAGAADEIKKVTSAVRSLGRALDKVMPKMSEFNDLMKGNSVNFNDNLYRFHKYESYASNQPAVHAESKGYFGAAF